MRNGQGDPGADGWEGPLDRLVLGVLAEARPRLVTPAETPADPVEDFLERAAAFLRGRDDARALLARLEAMLPAAPGPGAGEG